MFYYNYIKKKANAYLKPLTSNPNNRYLDLGIINPSIGTSNLGDQIIFDAVHANLRSMYPEALFTNFPSQLHTSHDAKLLMGMKDLLFVSGTNLLSSNMNERYQWKLDPGHKRFLKNNVVLMGVGWWQYQEKPNKYTTELLKAVLSEKYLHSVRDEYTKQMLSSIGIENVINTACPTMWQLSRDVCESVPKTKSKNVVTTLTFYNEDVQKDLKLLDLLQEKYENVYLWIQGLQDFDYLNKLYPKGHNIHLIPPSLEAYNETLKQDDMEYCGTRLHAGIRALQIGCRTLIIAVDNRAIEISKTTNLNVIKREDIELVNSFIDHSYSTKIDLPNESIQRWKSNMPKKQAEI